MKRRADGLYQKQITVIGVDGAKKQKCFYGKSSQEINKKILQYKGETTKGRLFSVVADEWWEKHQDTLTHNALHGYVSALNDSKHYFKNVRISDLKTRDILYYIDTFVSKNYARKTILTKLQIIRQVLDYAILNNELQYNVALSAKIPKGSPKTLRQPAPQKVLDIVKESDFLLGLFALYTGARRGELFALKYEDIDFENREISINKTVYYIGTKPHIKPPKTESGIRKVPLIDELADKIPKNKKGYIFNVNGELMLKSKTTRYWKSHCKKLGLGNVTLHQFRHSYATRLYELDVDVKSAQYLLGHADISTTQNIYTHITENKRKQNISKLQGF